MERIKARHQRILCSMYDFKALNLGMSEADAVRYIRTGRRNPNFRKNTWTLTEEVELLDFYRREKKEGLTVESMARYLLAGRRKERPAQRWPIARQLEEVGPAPELFSEAERAAYEWHLKAFNVYQAMKKPCTLPNFLVEVCLRAGEVIEEMRRAEIRKEQEFFL